MVANDLQILVIVVNNGMLGTIRMHQERHYPGRVMATDLVNPDFAAFARSFGAFGERVESTGEFAPALERALAAGGPALLELVCDPEALTPAAVALAGACSGRAQRGGRMERPPHLAGAAHRRRGRGAASSRPRRSRATTSTASPSTSTCRRSSRHRRIGARAREREAGRAARRRAAARQGHLRHGGRAHDLRLGDLPRQRPAALGHERAPPGRRRRDHARQGQPARVRLGRDVAQPRLRRRRQQRAPRSHPGRLLGRQCERARGGPVRARARNRHGRLDPAAGRGLRRGRLQAGLRQRPGRRSLAARALVRPRRPARTLDGRLRAGVRRPARRPAAAGRCGRPARDPARAVRRRGDDRGVPRGGRPAGRSAVRPPPPGRGRRGAPRDLREPSRRLRRRPPREDGRRLRRRPPASARSSSRRCTHGARRARRGASGTCSSRPRSRASCRPRTSRPRSS